MLIHTVVLFLVFKKTSIVFSFAEWLHQFTVPPTVYKNSLFSTSLPAFVICGHFDNSYPDRSK